MRNESTHILGEVMALLLTGWGTGIGWEPQAQVRVTPTDATGDSEPPQDCWDRIIRALTLEY